MKPLFLILLLSLAWPALAGTDAYEQRRAACVGWMMTAYPSGLEEVSCTAEFDLPSPFLFKCMRAQRVGFDSQTQKRACGLYLAQAADRVADGYVRN